MQVLCLLTVKAQLQVSQEPFHRPVLQNKYIRLLDVWLQPNDTTQFHVHSIPSLFIYLTKNNTASQVNGKEWVNQLSEPGKAWYRSFSPDTLVHRVANVDTVPFHVNDIEILSSYNQTGAPGLKPLPFNILLQNDKALVYELSNESIEQKITAGHGPLIAELISGEGIRFHDIKSMKSREIKAGQYVYIEPGKPFYFSKVNNKAIKMLLLEIK